MRRRWDTGGARFEWLLIDGIRLTESAETIVQRGARTRGSPRRFTPRFPPRGLCEVRRWVVVLLLKRPVITPSPKSGEASITLWSATVFQYPRVRPW
jgi:hypothetical protein